MIFPLFRSFLDCEKLIIDENVHGKEKSYYHQVK